MKTLHTNEGIRSRTLETNCFLALIVFWKLMFFKNAIFAIAIPDHLHKKYSDFRINSVIWHVQKLTQSRWICVQSVKEMKRGTSVLNFNKLFISSCLWVNEHTHNWKSEGLPIRSVYILKEAKSEHIDKMSIYFTMQFICYIY